jgi:hypothetical protein
MWAPRVPGRTQPSSTSGESALSGRSRSLGMIPLTPSVLSVGRPRTAVAGWSGRLPPPDFASFRRVSIRGRGETAVTACPPAQSRFDHGLVRQLEDRLRGEPQAPDVNRTAALSGQIGGHSGNIISATSLAKYGVPRRRISLYISRRQLPRRKRTASACSGVVRPVHGAALDVGRRIHRRTDSSETSNGRPPR